MNADAISSSNTGSLTPAPCIFPAIMIPEKMALACLIAAVISLFETPVEGFPVRQIKSNPSASARAMFFFVAKRPVAIVVSCSICSAQSSTGSRLTPIGRPVKHCKKRMGSSVVGNPLIARFRNQIGSAKSNPPQMQRRIQHW